MAVCEWCWIRAGYKAIARGIPHGDAYRDVVEEQERLGAAAECPQVTRRSRGEDDDWIKRHQWCMDADCIICSKRDKDERRRPRGEEGRDARLS